MVKEREVEFGYFRWTALCQQLLEWRFHSQLKFGCKGRSGAKGKAETQDTEGNTPRRAEAFGWNRLKHDRERRSSSSASFSWKLKNMVCHIPVVILQQTRKNKDTPSRLGYKLFCLDRTSFRR